jgi:hypothetical protein
VGRTDGDGSPDPPGPDVAPGVGETPGAADGATVSMGTGGTTRLGRGTGLGLGTLLDIASRLGPDVPRAAGLEPMDARGLDVGAIGWLETLTHETTIAATSSVAANRLVSRAVIARPYHRRLHAGC